MLAERKTEEIHEKVLKFVHMGPDEGVFAHYLEGTKMEYGEVVNELTIAFFPADRDLNRLELGVFTGKDSGRKSFEYRRNDGRR